MTKRLKIALAVAAIFAAAGIAFWLTREKPQMYHITGEITEIYRSQNGGIAVAIFPDGHDPQYRYLDSTLVLLGLRRTWGSEVKENEIEIGKCYTLMIFKPELLKTPLAWAALNPFEIKNGNEPNQSPEPTPTAVTPDADASVAPSAGAAHL